MRDKEAQQPAPWWLVRFGFIFKQCYCVVKTISVLIKGIYVSWYFDQTLKFALILLCFKLS